MATIKAVSVFQSIKEAFKLDHQIRPPRLTHPGFPIVLRPLTMDDEDGWNEVRWRNNDWLAPWESGDPMHGGSITFNQWSSGSAVTSSMASVIFAIEYQMRIVGQISLGAIVYGAMRTGVLVIGSINGAPARIRANGTGHACRLGARETIRARVASAGNRHSAG